MGEIYDLRTERRRRCKDRQLAIWLTVEGMYLSLCEQGLIAYDPKVLRELRREFKHQELDPPLRDVPSSSFFDRAGYEY